MRPPEGPLEPGFTEDAYFGGRVRLRQPAEGLRAGDDALLVAAAVPAGPGERVFEAGIGTAAAALALIARVGQVSVVGVEIDPGHAALARGNARLNGCADRLTVIEADIAGATPDALREHGLELPFDHAFANPPYHREGEVRPPASASRARAHLGGAGDLDLWLARLADLVKGRGTVTVIHRAAALGALLAAFEARLGGIAVLPLAARAGEPASRIIVQATKGSRAPLRLMPPLVLHGADGRYTSGAETVLREAGALDLGSGTVQASA